MKNGITIHELDDSLKKVLDDLKKSANDDQARKDINKIRDDLKNCISNIDAVSKKANNNENNFNAQIKKHNEDIANINSQYNSLPNKFTLRCAGAVDNFNNMLTQNEYTVGGTNIPNAPYSGNIYGKLIVIVSTGDTHNNKNNWLWQYFISTTSNEMYKRSKINADAWSQWEKVVTRKEIEDLKTHVGNGKNNLYAAITDKKVTPKSKDFADLVQGIKSIKLGQGNAQASQVLEGRTFTNDNGVMQTGIVKNFGDKVITPNKSIQTLSNGFYNNIKINPIDTNVLKNNFPELKPENIAKGVNIGGISGTAIKAICKTYEYTDITKFCKGEAPYESLEFEKNFEDLGFKYDRDTAFADVDICMKSKQDDTVPIPNFTLSTTYSHYFDYDFTDNKKVASVSLYSGFLNYNNNLRLFIRLNTKFGFAFNSGSIKINIYLLQHSIK